MSKEYLSEAELEAALNEDILFLGNDVEIYNMEVKDQLEEAVHSLEQNNLSNDLETGSFERCQDLSFTSEINKLLESENFNEILLPLPHETNILDDNENVKIVDTNLNKKSGFIVSIGDKKNKESSEVTGGNKENVETCDTVDTSRKNNKYRRMRGLVYRGLKKDGNGNYNMSEQKLSRKLGAKCSSQKCENSKNKNCSKFDDIQRKSIFQYFWEKLNWDTRKLYVANLIDVIPTKRRTTLNQPSSRSVTYVYYLKTLENLRLQVCKNMFLGTLGLKNSMVDEWCKKAHYGMHEADKKFPKRSESTTNKIKDSVTTMEMFFNELPKLPSHYCRASSSKQYLEPIYERKSDLYRIYKLYAYSKNAIVLSKYKFKEIFEKLNLALHKPKKDQCDTCISHTLGNILESDYHQHISNKDQARKKKEEDKKRAVDSDGTVAMFTADVQAVMVAPYLKASAIYYKTKICVHNYTIFNMVNKDVDCYLWDETEGALDANIFASLLIAHLRTYLNKNTNTKEIVIYTDSCGYQNKSALLANALFHFSRQNKIVIIHNYLEKGHTQMEVDSAHSLIERKKRNREIYLPTDYIAICREARISHPFRVHYMDHTQFKDFSNLKYYTSIRPGVRRGDPIVAQIKSLKYDSNNIQYKVNFVDNYSNYKHAPKIGDYTVKYLYKKPLKIPETKFKHLQELKSVLPKYTWNYYDNLKHY